MHYAFLFLSKNVGLSFVFGHCISNITWTCEKENKWSFLCCLHCKRLYQEKPQHGYWQLDITPLVEYYLWNSNGFLSPRDCGMKSLFFCVKVDLSNCLKFLVTEMHFLLHFKTWMEQMYVSSELQFCFCFCFLGFLFFCMYGHCRDNGEIEFSKFTLCGPRKSIAFSS